MPIISDLEKYRTEKKYSQELLASYFGVSQQTYSNIESGRRKKLSEEEHKKVKRLVENRPNLRELPSGVVIEETATDQQPTPPTPTPAQPFDAYLYQQVMTTKDQVINAERSASQSKDHVIKLQSEVADLRQEMNTNFLRLQALIGEVTGNQSSYMKFLVKQFAEVRNKDQRIVKKELDSIVLEDQGR